MSDSFDVPLGDGPDSANLYEVCRSRKIKDYFTGCLPWPQKGTASFINDIGNLSVTTTAVNKPHSGYGYITDTKDTGWMGTKSGDWNIKMHDLTTANGVLEKLPDAQLDITSTLSGSVHTTVNALREAFALQKILELDARGNI